MYDNFILWIICAIGNNSIRRWFQCEMLSGLLIIHNCVYAFLVALPQQPKAKSQAVVCIIYMVN